MDIKEFNEAIYASSNGVVVEHRKSIIAPVVVIAVGIALFVANTLISNSAETIDLKSTLILAGAFVVAIGAILLCVRLSVQASRTTPPTSATSSASNTPSHESNRGQ